MQQLCVQRIYEHTFHLPVMLKFMFMQWHKIQYNHPAPFRLASGHRGRWKRVVRGGDEEETTEARAHEVLQHSNTSINIIFM